MTTPTTALRIGADVGGTFTDLVAIAQDGAVYTKKVASTPDDFGQAIVEGLVELLSDAGLPAATVRELVHGTTVATNAILEHKGARTGLLTTAGFRDVLEIRRLRMPKLYDPLWDKPKPLVDREYRLEVDERLNGRGEVARPLDREQAMAVAERLVKLGAQSIAISLLHAYANPVHEHALRELIAERWPDIPLSLSSDILPAIREYERTSTTVVNAYVRPVVERYVRALLIRLAEVDIDAPVLIMQSNGGIMTAEAASTRPAYIIESGPAAGVIASVGLAARLGISDIITFDMGGTTAKASLIEGGEPSFTSEFEVGAGISLANRLVSGGGYALALPVIDLSEVGAGGGSIVWIDAGGAPRVGPQSAGAVPGPVCYMKGGEDPTVTDANVVLGYLNPEHLLDGAMPINAEAARRALQHRVAGPLGISLLEAAYGVHELANATMIRAVKAVSTYRGRDPREYAMVAFGGSGPIHAASMARELGLSRVLVPPAPGLYSAFGLLEAAIEHHTVRSFLRRTDQIAAEDLDSAFSALADEATADLTGQGYGGDRVAFRRAADMRYLGQSFQLTIPVPATGRIDAALLGELTDTFGREHLRTYGHRLQHPVEIVDLRLTAVIDGANGRNGHHLHRSGKQQYGKSGGRDAESANRVRLAYFGPSFGLVETPILRRHNLRSEPIQGPLVIEEYDATVVVPPDCTARLDDLDNIVIEVRAND